MTKETKTKPACHAESRRWRDIWLVFSAFSRRIFHPRPQEGVFRREFNKSGGIYANYPN